MIKNITNLIIEQYLCDYGRRYYLRELASFLKKPHQTIKPHAELLVKREILIKIKRKNLVEYSLNFKNKQIFDFLVVAEKEQLIHRLSRDILLKTLYEKVAPFFQQNMFVIFGSASEKLTKGSDIDLLVVGKGNIRDVLDDFETIYHKKIHLIQVNNIAQLDKVFVIEIYKKHLIFNHTEQLIRFFGELYEKNQLV